MSRAGFLYGYWVSRPFALVYTNFLAKSSKKALLSYVVFNNSVNSDIVVLTPFSKGEGVIFTLRNFIAYYSVNLFSPITPFIFNPLKNFSKEEQL